MLALPLSQPTKVKEKAKPTLIDFHPKTALKRLRVAVTLSQ